MHTVDSVRDIPGLASWDPASGAPDVPNIPHDRIFICGCGFGTVFIPGLLQFCTFKTHMRDCGAMPACMASLPTGMLNSPGRNIQHGALRRSSLPYVSVGLLESREQGNLRKCSPSALESALRNRGALGSAPESVLEGALPVVLYSEKTLESTLGSTPESTPISESTLESTRGALSKISLFSAP